MPSELDLQFKAVMDALTAPGALLETATFTRFGVDLPTFRNAPPSLPAYFAHYCAEHGEKCFLVDGAVRLTFAETYALARKAAAGLIARHHIAPGDRVGIAARNSANWVIAFMAVSMAGGCAVLLNGWWTGEELASGIALADCRLILADEPRAARLAEAGYTGDVLVIGHGAAHEGLGVLMGAALIGDALIGAGDEPLPMPGPDDLATILFTSGSTGLSKGAVSDHRGVVHGTMSFAAQTLMIFTYLGSKGIAPVTQPCALVGVPLFHVTGEIAVMLQSFALGRKLVMMDKWDAVEAMRLIEAEHVSYFVGVPLMSFEVATHPRRGEFDLSSVLHFAAGGAPRPIEHVGTIRANAPHAYPILGYGLTETNAVGCGNFNENYLAKPGSTGPASRPLVEIAILDDAGERLPVGVAGEVGIRSIANFLGYWRNEAATREAVTADGFFRTGDIGLLDDDGYLTIVDRKKDIIIRGGENISASEVEAALYAHPQVAEASVFGLPDARLGEVPVAVYFAQPGSEPDEAALRGHLEKHLAAYKIPVRFFRESSRLPRLGTEKVDKRSIKARYAADWVG